MQQAVKTIVNLGTECFLGFAGGMLAPNWPIATVGARISARSLTMVAGAAGGSLPIFALCAVIMQNLIRLVGIYRGAILSAARLIIAQSMSIQTGPPFARLESDRAEKWTPHCPQA